ncbi:sulfite exporter TauE/SafE family protein [Uliginosibacterium sp. H3]|uniref:Sulfite exporter TauE/SafE family protein n=1 Tax=Uliginosibacterium silvisoli TaxID=3114758 RepID=A0ABU6JZM7_9RHOO|nr:sulfite exporter TauE/SafE family protein [Uliginosibacterium sp. H3]
MNLALILSGAALGLASGGHCIAMCGAGSSYLLGSGAARAPRETVSRLGAFHGGRVAGYALVGALLGGTAAAFHALTEWVALLRPLWTMANTVMFLLGAALLITARQPQILVAIGEKAGRWLRGASGKGEQRVVLHPRLSLADSPLAGQPVSGVGSSSRDTQRSARRGLGVGLSWAFIPCGPLYSAWTLALFAGDPLSGALTAVAFASASGMQLAFAQWWLARFGRAQGDKRAAQGSRWDKLGIRFAGAALCLSAGYSIAMLARGGEGMGWFCL